MSILICFFLALIPYSTSITFNFTNFSSQNSKDIILSGDAGYINSEDGIQVTYKGNKSSLQGLAGRAMYFKPLRIYNKYSTGDLVSFKTSFTFVIKGIGQGIYGHGITFFLAQSNCKYMYARGSIGLPFNYQTNTSMCPFVAVEFDTFGTDEWDPRNTFNQILGDHVGININSITPVESRKWATNITYGKEYTASINYNASSKDLNVSFTSYDDSLDQNTDRLDYQIDLRDVLPELVSFGFSASTGDRYEKNTLKSWSFTDFKDEENKGKNNTSRNVAIITGALVVVTVLAILGYFIWRRKKSNNTDAVEVLGSTQETNNEIEIGATIRRRFSYLELANSTAGFAETEKLGEGGFGGVYKGFLNDLSMYVAVKRVSNTSSQGIKEYASEVRIITRLRHRNLVQLIGWCHERRELSLVYEFLENGSLDLHLFKGKSLLTWNTRYKIARGLASALLYLQEEWEQCVLHRDIKSSNVMLDSSFNAKLGDFGLAKLVDHDNGSETTIVAGTIGYMAPEYVSTGKASKESDIFSFGVVALEIACGRKPIDPRVEERKTNLVEWVWELYGTGTLLDAADPCLGSDFAEEEMTCLMIVGLWCAHPDLNLRPSMKQAIQVLNFEASLPILQPKMPDVPYSTLRYLSFHDPTLSSSSTKRSSKQSTSSTTNS